MVRLPLMLPGREITKKIAEIRETEARLICEAKMIDIAIKSLPYGPDRRNLQATHNQLKRHLGLVDTDTKNRRSRGDWPYEKLTASALELKKAARKWSAAGHSKRAEQCLKEARILERAANVRRIDVG